LLASFPARNSELWLHLARGRSIAGGNLAWGSAADLNWIYDLVIYGLYVAFGGPGLVLIKALLVAATGLIVLRLCLVKESWRIAGFGTALALLALGTRLPLLPSTISCFLLAVALLLLELRAAIPGHSVSGWLPPWPLLVLFILWANLDSWFVVGLGVVALVEIGRGVDLAGQGKAMDWPRLFGSFLILAAVCLLNPGHVHAFTVSADLTLKPYWEFLRDQGARPVSIAYGILLVLGGAAFALDLRAARWQWLLPWLALAALSCAVARAIPFFAVVGGPALAWTLQDLYARRWDRAWRQLSLGRSVLEAGQILTGVLLLFLPLCAWPGWLQTPPFEPRLWTIETPATLEVGARQTQRWLDDGKLGTGKRGLHLSPETAAAFAWFCPQDDGLFDESLSAILRGDDSPTTDWRQQMHDQHINHVIVYDPDPSRFYKSMVRLLEAPREWPLLYVEGYMAVFGWRDPLEPPYPFQELDWNRLAFAPDAEKKAPAKAAVLAPEPREWYEALWKPAPRRSVDAAEATQRLMHAQYLQAAAPPRHLVDWEASQIGALVIAVPGWSGGVLPLFDARMRLTYLDPLPAQSGARLDTLPIPDQIAHLLQSTFTLQRDDTPPALLFLAIRAARRALAVNPENPQPYLILGECYLRLLRSTRERMWARNMPELGELRRAQASAALHHAITLKPDFAQAHLLLAGLYRDLNYFDLMLDHMRIYRELVDQAGPPPGVDAEEFRAQQLRGQEELRRLAAAVEKQENTYEVATSGMTTVERARYAGQQGLMGKSLALLLSSDIAAFGESGAKMELELLLRTGRAQDAYEWSSEVKNTLGPSAYYWLRTQALAASGEYRLARDECELLAQTVSASPPGQPSRFREAMAGTVGQRILEEQPAARSLPNSVKQALDRAHWIGRITSYARSLRGEADMMVLRGLLALEEGDVMEAESLFNQSLTYWISEEAALAGNGLDFNGRPVAQGYSDLIARSR
jgi:hypothetical protein